jgi:hypothetical protein
VKVEYTPRSIDALDGLPAVVRRAFYKQLTFLVADMRHPSLRVKKYGGVEDLWQARINSAWRFYFQIVDDTYLITSIIPHPK